MDEKTPPTDIRDTLGAPTLLESAREAQRQQGQPQARSTGNGDDDQGTPQDQWTTKRLNPMSVDKDEGGTRQDRRVQQEGGMVDDDESAENTRKASSFLGKKLFGERFSGAVDEDGNPIEGDDGKGKKDKKAGEEEGGKKSAEEEQVTDDGKTPGGKGPRVTKTGKSDTKLSREDIASVVKATIEGTRATASSPQPTDGADSHVDPNKDTVDSMSTKDKRNFTIIQKMAESMPEYEELPGQFIEFQKAKNEYETAWKAEHPGEKINWKDDEHENWVEEHYPDFDSDDFETVKIEVVADSLAEKKMSAMQEKLDEANRKASEGTLKEQISKHAKLEIEEFKKNFVPEAEWDLSTPEGRAAASEEDPILGEVAAAWAEQLEVLTGELVRLYDNSRLWKADPNNKAHATLGRIATDWENLLKNDSVESTKNKDGKLFATREEYIRMGAENRAKHWIIGRDEMLWVLPQVIKKHADAEKEAVLDKQERIAKAKGYRFDRDSITTQKKRTRTNPDGIDESGDRATRGEFDRGRASQDERPPSSTSGSRVDTIQRDRQSQNKDWAKLLATKLFGRQG